MTGGGGGGGGGGVGISNLSGGSRTAESTWTVTSRASSSSTSSMSGTMISFSHASEDVSHVHLWQLSAQYPCIQSSLHLPHSACNAHPCSAEGGAWSTQSS